ncbi:hypothetical protein [Halorubrum vacuolatum]|uniref:hypothetical protein n=1 Tax=Halorubrum vacuolatum TaxID=63740 RepID=UPI000B78DB8B|nr:hypothetical protein [Halorubrum vacuolatum]
MGEIDVGEPRLLLETVLKFTASGAFAFYAEVSRGAKVRSVYNTPAKEDMIRSVYRDRFY